MSTETASNEHSAATDCSTGFRVPVTNTRFEPHCETRLNGTLIVLYRGSHGWRAAEGRLAFARLPGQIYTELLEPLIRQSTTYEIVAIDLRSGQWQTIWARSDSDVSCP